MYKIDIKEELKKYTIVYFMYNAIKETWTKLWI